MKKITIAFLCLLLVATMAVSVYAANGFSMSASSKNLHRGDTVTLTVSVSCSEPATSYGLQLSFDQSVFELVNGSTSVPGALVNSFNNGFAFMFQTPTAYSGSVGTVTLKVKDTAAFGSFTVSGSASVKNGSTVVSVSGSSVSLKVVCDHNYGAWEKVDDTNHGKTCSVCQDVQKEGHKWDNGTTIKQANCKEGGQIKYTCTTCSATKTVDTAKTTDHKYGDWTKVNDATHKHTCSVCTKEETVNHTWDKGKATKPATCKEEGVKTYTCADCKATKTEKIDKTTDHSFGSWVKVDDTTHKSTCSVCAKAETAAHTWNSGVVTKKATCKEEGVKTYTCTGCNATKTEVIEKLTTHTYDHDCDTDCNVCGVTRTITHNYKTKWSKDKTNHWHECSVCKDKKDVAKHTPGKAATETRAQTCTECGYVIKAALGHKHKFATSWTTDEAGHWYTCSGCDDKGSYADHDFENACDPDCSVCGYTREVAHTFGEWVTDADNHWHECAGCGLKQEEAAHEPGAEATATTAQTCTICGYEIAPALGEPEIPTEEPTQPTETEPVQNPADETSEFPWWIVIVVGVAAVAAVVVIVIKKKK